MHKRLAWLVMVVVGAVVAATILYVRNRATPGPALTTSPVTRGDIVETVDAVGTLQAVTTVQIGTQVSGTIKALDADFNSRVRRGQVIARLEPSLFESQVEQARASVTRLDADVRRAAVQLEDAQQKLRRARELSDHQLVSATDLETAEVAVRVAEAALNAAQAQVVQAGAALHQSEVNLAHTIITSPIDGIVISRNVDVGQTVAASMQAPTLFVVARDLREMQVEARVAESDIGRIEAGQTVSFQVDAHPGRTFTGVVSQVRLQPIVEQNVVSYVTVIDVPNPDLRLKPGMTANVTVEVARASDVLRVPNAALRLRPSPEVLAAFGETPVAAVEGTSGHGDRPAGKAPIGSGGDHSAEVWVLAGTHLSRVPVLAGISDGSRTAVLSAPLDEGAQVVTAIATDAAGATPTQSSPLLPSFRGRGLGTGRGAGAAPPAGR